MIAFWILQRRFCLCWEKIQLDQGNYFRLKCKYEKLIFIYFCSQEEIESLREKMVAQTSLVVVGSADDALRINKFNRHLEGVTQSMVDNMIAVRQTFFCNFQHTLN